jgi:beta-glucanase (GH16 family)
MLIARIALALGFLVAMLPSCAWAQQSAVPDKYVLQWSEDFKGTVLDASKWNYRTDVKLYSAQTPANISLDGAGHMNITLRQEDFAGKHFTGGGIISKAAFRYGYYEAEARQATIQDGIQHSGCMRVTVARFRRGIRPCQTQRLSSTIWK